MLSRLFMMVNFRTHLQLFKGILKVFLHGFSWCLQCKKFGSKVRYQLRLYKPWTTCQVTWNVYGCYLFNCLYRAQVFVINSGKIYCSKYEISLKWYMSFSNNNLGKYFWCYTRHQNLVQNSVRNLRKNF